MLKANEIKSLQDRQALDANLLSKLSIVGNAEGVARAKNVIGCLIRESSLRIDRCEKAIKKKNMTDESINKLHGIIAVGYAKISIFYEMLIRPSDAHSTQKRIQKHLALAGLADSSNIDRKLKDLLSYLRERKGGKISVLGEAVQKRMDKMSSNGRTNETSE